MTIAEIRRQLDEWGIAHSFRGDENREIKGFSDPKSYLPNTLIWIGKLEDIDTAQVAYDELALVFVKDAMDGAEVLPNVIALADPKNAFMKLVIREYGAPVQPYRDPSACISPEAVVDASCYIGRNVVIEAGAEIGAGCEIRENVYIGKNCILGPDCIVGQNAVIGGETNGSYFEDGDGVMKNMPNVGIVRIGKGVQIGAASIIAKATFTETVIGDECELNAGTAIGHNCRIGQRVQMLGRCTISGNTSIGDGSQLISACVKNRIVIGKNVKVGMGSVVLKDIPDGKLCFGNPARIMPG